MEYEVRKSPAFEAWLKGLTDRAARDAINARTARMRRGLFGDRRSVGDRVSELRVDVGAGLPAYYTMGGRTLVLLLCGGTKRTQSADIRKAEAMAKAADRKRDGRSSRVRERQADYAADTDQPVITDADIVFSPFDPADYLEGESSQIYLLRDALASGHPGYIADAIGAVARARGLSNLQRATGIKRQTLNKSLSLKGNPTLATLVTVLKALGMRLEIVRGEMPDFDAPDRC